MINVSRFMCFCLYDHGDKKLQLYSSFSLQERKKECVHLKRKSLGFVSFPLFRLTCLYVCVSVCMYVSLCGYETKVDVHLSIFFIMRVCVCVLLINSFSLDNLVNSLKIQFNLIHSLWKKIVLFINFSLI